MDDLLRDFYKKSFGAKLKKAREARCLSIRKVSSITGISASYLSYIERGVHGPPSMEVIEKLVLALETDKDELIAAAGYVSKEVSEAYHKNPKEISGIFKKTGSDKWLGIILALLFVAYFLEDETDQEEEELPDPIETFKQLKEAYLDEDSSITREREYFDYYTGFLRYWKTDLEQREKRKKK